ncbi:MAG: hypothetical protein ACRBK7_02165, partial [Acidimicrobiales bacterium]
DLGSNPTDANVAAILRLPPAQIDQVSAIVRELGDLVARLLDDHESERHETWTNLLEQAIILFDESGTSQISCPVCDRAVLGADWREHAATELTAHRAATTNRIGLRKQIFDRRQQLLSFLTPLQNLAQPRGVRSISELVAVADKAVEEVRESHDIPRIDQLVRDSIKHFETVRQDAESIQVLDQSRFKPAIEACRTWIEAEKRSCEFKESKRDLECARDWVSAEIDRQREYRMGGLSLEAAEIWKQLSPGDSIEFEAMQLLGSKSKRKLDLNCQTEGQSAKARSILSVGQMHALALSIFIPRATHTDSPFGFLFIDDPIHALDGIKIDGLAQVLHEIAKERQVVVCTHDRRLEAALETLRLPTTILRLERGVGSQVNVAAEENEVVHRLEDARSLASDSNIDDETRLIAVAGCCRTALEGAAARHFRRTAMASGLAIEQVEAELEKVDESLWDKIELAVYGNQPTDRDTASRIQTDYSKSIRDLIGLLNSSGHEAPENCRPGKLPKQTKHAISQLFPSVVS